MPRPRQVRRRRSPPHGGLGEHALADRARLDAPAVGEPVDDQEAAPVAVVVAGLPEAGQPLPTRIADGDRPGGPIVTVAPAAWDAFQDDLRRQLP
ncbi:DUF397 domain-containing protein [Streptomyces sp. cmx-18-6]|uniref:DUF397 domain-containing protein n=1 Tax=Streptomyces sp. cmx-18-6 TaxID=2790930 RepID=UPI00397ECC29